MKIQSSLLASVIGCGVGGFLAGCAPPASQEGDAPMEGVVLSDHPVTTEQMQRMCSMLAWRVSTLRQDLETSAALEREVIAQKGQCAVGPESAQMRRHVGEAMRCLLFQLRSEVERVDDDIRRLQEVLTSHGFGVRPED